MPSIRKPADLARSIGNAKRDSAHEAQRLEEWHVDIYRPGSAVPDIAQATLPTWRVVRTYIGTARRIWPDGVVWVKAPEICAASCAH